MVLLNDVIEVPALAQMDTARQYTFGFQCFYRRWKSRVPVHVDYSRYRIAGRAQSGTEEAFRSSCIPSGREQKVDGLTCRINGAIQVLVLALHPYIGLVGAVALVGGLQVYPTAPVQLRGIGLNPAPDAARIQLNPTFGQKLGDVSVSQRIAQVPPDTKDDHLTRKMATFERVGRGDRHGLPTLPDVCPTVRNGSELNVHQAEEQSRAADLANCENSLDGLRDQLREAGGWQIENLRREKESLEGQREKRLRKRGDAQRACQQLGWRLPAKPSEFAEVVNSARQELDRWPDWQDKSREHYAALKLDLARLGNEFSEAKEEVESLVRQASNVPAKMLRLRTALTQQLGIVETALPFTAELLEVLPREEEWRGAIERVLGGFALTLLVEERYYTAVSDYVNRTFLQGDRLFYNRVTRDSAQPTRAAQPNSLVRKLQVKEGSFEAYLRRSLIDRFDYACVDSMQAFRGAERAVTRQGQIRHSKERHEKDDRRDLNDRSRWVLGFDNRAKRQIFEAKAHQAAAAIETCKRELRSLEEENQSRSQRALQCQMLSNAQWEEIDVDSLLQRIRTIDKTVSELQEGNPVLQDLDHRIQEQRRAVDRAGKALVDTRADMKKIEQEVRKYHEELKGLRGCVFGLSETQNAELSKRFSTPGQPLKLEHLDRQTHEVDRKLAKELQTLAEDRGKLKNSIERRFAEFKRHWPADAADVDDTVASALDYLSKLTRLENDRLPDYEQRFFDLLRNQSHQNLAALSTHLNQARKTIFERLELVNRGLSEAPFGHGTYLRIDPNDRNLDEVREFRQEIQRALSHAWTADREEAEARFVVLRRLVERLGSQEPAQRRWRTLVLDVRQHVEFIGREIDAGGNQVEVYRGGAGKSGGQRQKLATTCLAAALRYQLGGDAQGLPQYAPVLLDEAFDKADNEFTALAMNIFASFGFQMIVATPLKSVMTLEPFIGGACFVDIQDRRHSSILMIEYDTERSRLNLPLPLRSYDETGAAVS